MTADYGYGDIDESGCCTKCGAQRQVGDYPMCPHGYGAGNTRAVVDDIPGGMVIENLGRDPVKVYSHTERRAIMNARGLEEFVRHAPIPGTDKSPYTTDWSKGSIDAYTLEAARYLVENRMRGNKQDPDAAWAEGVVQNRFSVAGNRQQTREVMRIIADATSK